MYKNHLLKGALLLTAAGVFSRIIGFFYRIFLSRTFGAEQMGIYELISPVLALSFALCTSAIQSSISKFTAAEPEAAIYAKRRILLTGLSVSFVLSCLCTLFVWREADFISDFLLKETRCAPLLKIAALSFPAACIHSCINGYYYGIRKSFFRRSVRFLNSASASAASCFFGSMRQLADFPVRFSSPQSDLSSGNALPWWFPFLPQESIFRKNCLKAFRSTSPCRSCFPDCFPSLHPCAPRGSACICSEQSNPPASRSACSYLAIPPIRRFLLMAYTPAWR